MTLARVKELENQVQLLKKELKETKVDNSMLNKYLNEKGLIDDYTYFAENRIREAQADILRKSFNRIK
jgi:hypothetical protein